MSLRVEGAHSSTVQTKIKFHQESYYSSETKKKITNQIKEIQEDWKKADHLHKKANVLKKQDDPNLKDAIDTLTQKANRIKAIADKKWELFRKTIENKTHEDTSEDALGTDSESLSLSSSSTSTSTSSSELAKPKMIVIKRKLRTPQSQKSNSASSSAHSSFISSNQIQEFSQKSSSASSSRTQTHINNHIQEFNPATLTPWNLECNSSSVSASERTKLHTIYKSQKAELAKLEKKQSRTNYEERAISHLQKLLQLQKKHLQECGISLSDL